MAGLRKLPAATGPPARAVLLALLLVGLPFPLGVSAWDETSPGTLIVGLSAPLTALWFARVFPAGYTRSGSLARPGDRALLHAMVGPGDRFCDLGSCGGGAGMAPLGGSRISPAA